ncbi:hypothetical protein LALA110947_05680 [Lactococcus laudensis]
MKVLTLGEMMLRLSTLAGQRLTRVSSLNGHYGGGRQMLPYLSQTLGMRLTLLVLFLIICWD